MSKQLPETYFRLADIRALIATPDRWCQYMYSAETLGGRRMLCLGQAADEVGDSRAITLLRAAIDEVPAPGRRYRSFEAFNDNNSHETVLAVVDRAMALSLERVS